MHSNYKHIGRGLAESAASVLKGETLNKELNEELSAAQKKLPAGLQKAIAKKDGDKSEMMEPKKDKEKVEQLTSQNKDKIKVGNYCTIKGLGSEIYVIHEIKPNGDMKAFGENGVIIPNNQKGPTKLKVSDIVRIQDDVEKAAKGITEGMKMASNHKMKKAEKEPYHPGEGEHNQEELSPAQKKIDKNNNGKVDGEDLAKLRAKKEQLEEVIRELESKLVE